MSLSQHQKEIETSPQDSPSKIPRADLFVFSRKMTLGEMNLISKASTIGKLILLRKNSIQCVYCQVFRAIPHNSKCRYGERGAAAAKPKAQIILCAAKVSAAGGGYSEPKQGQRSQSARGFCPRSTMRVPQPGIIEHFGNADAVPQPPERCLSRKAGIVRCCLRNTCKIYLRNRNTFCPALRYNKIRFQPFKEGTTQPWQK